MDEGLRRLLVGWPKGIPLALCEGQLGLVAGIVLAFPSEAHRLNWTTPEQIGAALLGGAILATIAGAIQWLVLLAMRHPPKALAWAALNVVGLLLGAVVLFALPQPDVTAVVVVESVIGVGIALQQGRQLAAHLSDLGGWWRTALLCWGGATAVSLMAESALPPHAEMVGLIIFSVAAGRATYGFLVNLALLWWLKNPSVGKA